MLVKSFFAWMDEAGPVERADAADMLAHAYLANALGGDTEADVLAALTMVLDDPAPEVRRALALVFAEAENAPRHIILSLAQDQPSVAAILIARSPVLKEADLVELASTVDGHALIAIGMRKEISVLVSHAVFARKNRDALGVLISNAGADIKIADFEQIVSDFGADAGLREILLARSDLPPTARQGLLRAVSSAIGNFVSTGGFLTDARARKVMDETILTGTLEIIAREPKFMSDYVRYLRNSEQLTASLILRSVLGGNLDFLACAFAELLDMPLARVTGLLSARTDSALSALIKRSGLPEFLERPLIGAIRASREATMPTRIDGFDLAVIRAAQSACLDVPDEAGIRLLALLRRYEADAARSESRKLAESLRSELRGEKMLQLQLSQDQQSEVVEHEIIEGQCFALSDPREAAANLAVIEAEVAVSDAEPNPAVRRDRDLDEIGYEDDSWLLDRNQASTPDLKSVINAWKRERDQRYAVPVAENNDSLRKVA